MDAAGLLPIPVGRGRAARRRARPGPPASAPPGMPGVGMQVGVSNYPHPPLAQRLAVTDRLQHLHMLGPNGRGQIHAARQPDGAGHRRPGTGWWSIDPKSDLVARRLLPGCRRIAFDIIVADAAATERPVGFNILRSAQDEQPKKS